MSTLIKSSVVKEYVPIYSKSLKEVDMEIASSIKRSTSYLRYWWNCLVQWLGLDPKGGYVLGTETQCTRLHFRLKE